MLGIAILAEPLESGSDERPILTIQLHLQPTNHLVQRCFCASLLRPTIPTGCERQQEDGRQSPTHPTLPNAGGGLLVGPLSLSLRQRLGLFQFTFLRCPLGLGPLPFLVQFCSVRRLALAEK